jgi:putative transcriptional regulator
MLTQLMVQSRLKLLIAEHNLRRIRKGEKPISIRDISDATGLAPSTITGLTANRSKGVSFETVSALCNYFHCPPGDLFLFTPDDEPDRMA